MLLEKVRAVLNYIKEKSLENIFRRHNRLARATRAAVQATFYPWLLRTTQLIVHRGVFPNGVDCQKFAFGYIQPSLFGVSK